MRRAKKWCYCSCVVRKNFRLHEAGSTLAASHSCTHGPRSSLLIWFLVSIKFENIPYLNFYQHGSIDRCIIIIPTDIALWRYNDSQCSLHSIRTCLGLVLYTVLLCGRDPSERPQLVLSNSYSVKKNFGVPKGVSAETVETPLDPPLYHNYFTTVHLLMKTGVA